jgi:hypothetical protein
VTGTDAVAEELLAVHHDGFADALARLAGMSTW